MDTCQADKFQSSAAPKDGCNHRQSQHGNQEQRFQSSAAPKDGCNVITVKIIIANRRVSILSRPEGRLQQTRECRPSYFARFNPQPPRRTAATRIAMDIAWLDDVSILSRPEGRLQQWLAYKALPIKCVSILSRPEGRLQQARLSQLSTRRLVSILSRPEGRLQRSRQSNFRERLGFNPQPPRRTAATKSPK